MTNPFNPLDWVKSAQDWFSRTERSSGFRAYLVFLIIHIGFVIVLLSFFPGHAVTSGFAVNSLYISLGGFVVLYFIKAFQDPNFCRSEKHVENVKRIELMEQKGDPGPRPISASDAEVIDNPERLELPARPDGGE